MKTPETIKIDDVTYVRADLQKQQAPDLDGMPYVICRTNRAGVHAGYLKERSGQEAVLLKSRRIWYWEGAASLSQLAQSGTSKPNKCKFPEEVDQVILTDVIEILSVTAQAKSKIDEVPVWRA